MEQLLSGFLVTILTQVAKKTQNIPINEGEKGKIRTLVVVLSTVTTLATAYLDGSLASSSALQLVADSLSTWIYSVIAYHGIVK